MASKTISFGQMINYSSEALKSKIDLFLQARRPIGLVLEDYLCHHFVESVCNPVFVFVTNLVGTEVCCDDGEQLLVVSVGQQIYHRI